MPLFQPTNCSPSLLGPLGSGTVDAGTSGSRNPITFSWQVNGNEPMTAFRIQIYRNYSSGQQIYDSGKLTTNCPFNGTDGKGNPVLFTYTLSAADSTLANNLQFKWIVTQWWGDSSDANSIVQTSASAFNTQAAPTVTISDHTTADYGRTGTWTATYTGGPLMWVRWQLYTWENNESYLIDDTGEIATITLSYTYSGIDYSHSYSLVCTIQDTYGVQATANGFYAQSIPTKPWLGEVQACRREDMGGTLVKWSRVLDTPSASRTQGVGVGDGILYVQSENDSITWDTTNGAAMRIVWPWSAVWMGYATSLPMYLFRLTVGQTSGGENIYYTVYVRSNRVTVYLGGVQIGDALIDCTEGDRLAVVATPTQFWVSVWHGTYATATAESGVAVSFSNGVKGGRVTSLLLNEDDSLSVTYQTSVDAYATTANAKLSQTVYNIISGVSLYGPQECKYFWVLRGSLADNDAANIIGGAGDYQPSWSINYDTWFLTNFGGEDTFDYDYRYIGGNVAFGSPFTYGGADIYRKDAGSPIYRFIGHNSLPSYNLIVDASAKSNQTAEYIVWFNDASNNLVTTYWYGTTSVTPCFAEWQLISATQNSDGSYTPDQTFRFRYNVSTGAMTNSNTPNVLQNFTQYPTVQLATANYKAGTLTGYIGSLDGNYQYTESIKTRDALFALSVSAQPLFLRNRKGDFMRVAISAPVTATVADNTRQQIESISVSWVEVDDASKDRVFLQPPNDILSVTATAQSSAGNIRVNWGASLYADTYQVQRQTYGDGAWYTIASGLTVQTYYDAAIVSGTQYRYRVCGVNVTGGGNYTESSYATAP